MRTQSITVNVPVVSFGWVSKLSAGVKRTGIYISTSVQNGVLFLGSFISALRQRGSGRMNLESQPEPQLGERRKFSFKKIGKPLKFISIAAVLIIVVAIAGKAIVKAISTPKTSTTSTDVKPPLATLEINKELSFPLNDENGKKVADIKYLIETAELRDEILVQGQRATAVKGRVFLVLTVKITNDYKGSIQINSKDYVRLSVNGNKDEWLAPDIHNDPVDVQAISTKYTRLGFAINTSDKDLVLRVGEVGGEKEEIPLNFQK
jgi:hypothetical protein